MKTAIIEKYSTLGGTCLNVGCIPSKALLDSSHHYEDAVKHFEEHGIEIPGEVKVNLEKMIARKQGVVDMTTKGVQFLMDKNKIDVSTLPFIKLDKERVITSTEALKLKEIPKHLVIIGGGVIGLELGQVYKRLGSEVTVVEYMDRIIPTMDASLSKELMKTMKKQKVKFALSADYCLVAVGRNAYTEGLNLEAAGVQMEERGKVAVNDHLQTNIENIYAIGDVIKGAMLAHKAEEEGTLVAEIMAGQKPHIDYNLIPGVVYTWPEVAAVGKTEEELKEAGVEYKVGQFPMRALGRARASMDVDGFVKILADKKTDEVLGVHMIGARCADLITEAVTAMEFRASAEDIARMSHAHPTYAEAVKEAALAATADRALHV